MSAPAASAEPSAVETSLRRTAVANLGLAAFWKSLSWIVNGIVGIALARLLSRADFGFFGIATALTGFFARLSESGIAAAVVRSQRDDPATLETAFTLRSVALLLSGLLLAGSAPLWASLYGQPAVAPFAWSIFLPTVLSGFFFIPSVRLYRDYRHGRTRFAQFAGEAAKGAGVLVAALLGAGVWSFVVGVTAGSVASWACYVAFAPWRPRFRLDGKVARELLGFGKYVLAADLLTFAIGNVDNALVGKLLGPATLGDYIQAYAYGSWAVAEIAQLLSETLYPAFARRRDNVAAQRAGWRATLRATSAVVFPLTMGLAAVAPDFVRALLEPADEPGKWEGAIVPLRVLCAFGLVLSFERVSRPVLFAGGAPRAVMIGQGVMLAVLVAGLVAGIRAFGLPGAAAACVLAAICATAIVLRAAGGAAGIGAREIARDLAGPFAAAVGMAGLVLLAGSALGPGVSPAGRLLTQVPLGVVAYLGLGRLLMPATQREIFSQASSLLPRRGPQ